MELKTKLIKLPTLCLTLSFLVGCASTFPKPPDVQPKQILSRFNKCKIYKPRYADKMYFDLVGEVPLEQCLVDGFFVISDEELTRIRNFYPDAKQFYQQNCTGKNGEHGN